MVLEFKKWSNLLFFIPLLIALFSGMYIMSVFIFATMFVSFVFHVHEEKKWKEMDRITAFALIGGNFVLSYLFGFAFPYFYLALFFGGYLSIFTLTQIRRIMEHTTLFGI